MKIVNWFNSRFEVLNAVLIAIVSLSTALAVWRTNVVGSDAAEQGRAGLIDSIKEQAVANENYRKLYEEAGYAYQYAVKQAEAGALALSNDRSSRDRAANIEQYLLPNLQLIASPLATDAKYQNQDGTYDLQKRLADMADEEQRQLDPQAAFSRADSFYAEQRWLVIGSVLLAVSLFMLALAEITGNRMRILEFWAGLAFFLLGSAWLLGVEFMFLLVRGGGS